MKPRYIFIAFCLLCTSTALKAQTVNDFSTGLTKHVTKEDSINYILSDTIILDRSAVTGDNITDPIEVGTYSVSFSYTDTRNTFYPYTNKYGQYTRDVFYRLVLTVPMNVTFTHEGSALSDTYMHLLDSAGNRIALNDDYSGEGHCNNTQHSYINRMLAAGTYYVVSEGFNRNGNVTTNITGYASTTFNYPSIPSSYSTMPGTAVGGMGATVCVSPMGGATCSIPIEIPVGLGDMQPNLSIVYNSQSGNGMCGYGANLSGISVITRGVKDIYHDGSAQGMKYLADDALYLDGVRLILTSGTEGQEGAIYNPESDPFTKVISHGTCTATSNNIWFEVRATNGIIYRYGYNDNTRLTYTEGNSQRIYAWYLYRAQRSIGNHITYSYQHNDNCLYPYQISYGGNIIQNTAHPNVVEFTYETRNDSVPIRFDGHKGNMKKRLKTITSKTNNSIYRTYTLNYNTTGDGTARKFSRLTSVAETNGQNESLPSTQLNWSYLPSVGYSSNTPAIQSMVSMNNKVNEPTFAACDLNGDGIDDIIGFGKSGESNDKKLYLYKYLSQKTNNGNVNHYDTIAQTITPSYTILEGDYPDYFFNAVDQSGIGGASSVDYNGDGINELMIGHRYCSISYGVFPNDTIEDYLEFIMIKDDSHVYVNKTLLRTNCSPLYSVGDIDNDGRTDIVVLETVRDLSGLAKLHILSNSVAPSDYAAFDIFDNPVSFSLDCDVYLRNVPERMFLSDMNGNGMTDLLILYDNGYDILWNRGGGISSSNLIYLNGYYDNAYHHHGTELENYNTVTAGDFNGDGMLDVLTNARNSSKWYLHTCNGDGTFNRILALDSSDLGDQDFTERDNNKICNVVDFDGDGRSDVIVTKGIYEIETDILGNEWGEFDHVLTKWLCSTGASFEEKHSATSMRYDDMNSKKYITGDFDGDGHVELVNYGYDCVNGNNSDSDPVWRIYKNSNLTVQSGKVTSVTGDFGVTTSITYSTLADQSVYTRGTAEPYPAPRYTIPMNVVKQTIQNNGAAGNQVISYSYTGLKIHLQGKGLLGFNKTIADNSTTGVKTENGITQWDNTFYIPKITYSKITIDSLIAQTVNTLAIVDKEYTRYFAYPSVSVNTDMDGYSVTTHRHYNTDYGYIISDTTFYGTNMFRATRYHNYTEAGAAFHPQTIVTGQRHPDDNSGAFTRTTTYLYNNHGFVTRKTENKFSEDSLVTEYAYDLYGNMESQIRTGSGITTPCTTRYSYDDTHRFPLRVYTDPASSVHKYTYDPWGNVLAELDSINASRTDTISKNTYDGWGNIVRTEIPGRGEVTYTRGWNNDAGKRYFPVEIQLFWSFFSNYFFAYVPHYKRIKKLTH